MFNDIFTFKIDDKMFCRIAKKKYDIYKKALQIHGYHKNQ